jgi:hypothetical protein
LVLAIYEICSSVRILGLKTFTQIFFFFKKKKKKEKEKEKVGENL